MQHRIRQAKGMKGDAPYIFLEIEPDSWIETNVKPDQVAELKPSDIETFIRSIKESEKPKPDGPRSLHMTYAERAFKIGLIKDWEDVRTIETTIQQPSKGR